MDGGTAAKASLADHVGRVATGQRFDQIARRDEEIYCEKAVQSSWKSGYRFDW